MELAFKALSDSTRRELLDELFRRDGQTPRALASRFDMTRVAVAKHLHLLEDAGLVVTRRRGREKLHYLNPVPIRLVHDRWISKYTEAWAAGLADLKRDLEATMEKIFEIYIRTTPDRLWQAITDPAVRGALPVRRAVGSTWTAGSGYQEGTSRVTCEIEPVGDSCRLTVTHDQVREDADPHVYGGWPMILSGLKTWLETGQELTTPGSLMYRGSS